MDACRAKLEYLKLKEQVLSLAARWTPHSIPDQSKTSGQKLAQEPKASSDLPVLRIVPHDDKFTRFQQIVHIIESGKVFLQYQAMWLNDFEHEILMFPEAQHNDRADSTV
ncbi:MAG: phage terminase large subunit [Wolbachia sp.]